MPTRTVPFSFISVSTASESRSRACRCNRPARQRVVVGRGRPRAHPGRQPGCAGSSESTSRRANRAACCLARRGLPGQYRPWRSAARAVASPREDRSTPRSWRSPRRPSAPSSRRRRAAAVQAAAGQAVHAEERHQGLPGRAARRCRSCRSISTSTAARSPIRRARRAWPSVCMAMLTEGTEQLDKIAVRRGARRHRVEHRRATRGDDTQGSSLGSLTKHLDTTFALFVDTLRAPGLPRRRTSSAWSSAASRR